MSFLCFVLAWLVSLVWGWAGSIPFFLLGLSGFGWGFCSGICVGRVVGVFLLGEMGGGWLSLSSGVGVSLLFELQMSLLRDYFWALLTGFFGVFQTAFQKFWPCRCSDYNHCCALEFLLIGCLKISQFFAALGSKRNTVFLIFLLVLYEDWMTTHSKLWLELLSLESKIKSYGSSHSFRKIFRLEWLDNSIDSPHSFGSSLLANICGFCIMYH